MAIDISAIQSRIPNAFDQVLSGYGAGLQIRDARREQQMQEAAMREKAMRQQQAREAMGQLIAMPNPSTRDFANILMQFPELGDSLKAPIEMLDKERQQTTREQAVAVYSAMSSGQGDIAKRLLEDQLAAAEDAGDERGAAGARAMLLAMDTNPDAARNSAGLFLAAAMGPEEFANVSKQLQDQDRARRMAELDARKFAADIGLTEAQTQKTLADTAKLSADTQKLALEMEAMKNGKTPVDPEKKFDFETKLRGEYNGLTKEFHTVQESYRRIQATNDNAVGDLSLIFNYMKMLDPASVVRETEFANAQNAAGVPDRVRNIWNRILEGERLNPNQRDQFRKQADSLVKAARIREQEVRAGLMPVVDSYGLDAENVFSTTPEDVSDFTDEELDAEIARLKAAQGM